MRTRVIVGAALAVLLLAVLWLGGYFFAAVLSLFALAAVYEVKQAFCGKGINPIAAPLYVFAASFTLVFYQLGLLPMIALYVCALMATMIFSLFTKKHSTSDMIASLVLFVYPTFLFVCMMLVYLSFDRSVGITAACLSYAAAECADTFAYFGGTLFGKTKLCPWISPKKTVEGAAFAVLGGVVFGVATAFLQRLWGGGVHWAICAALGLVSGIFSQFGDLFASTIKRWANVKDFSSVFPGHGGIMDRIDSILFCAPPILLAFAMMAKWGLF